VDERAKKIYVSVQNLLLFGYLMSLCSGSNMLSWRSLYCDRSIGSAKAISLDSEISASSFKFQYILFSLRFFTSYLCLLPRIPVPSIFLSITCFRRQMLRKDILLCSIFCSSASFQEDISVSNFSNQDAR